MKLSTRERRVMCHSSFRNLASWICCLLLLPIFIQAFPRRRYYLPNKAQKKRYTGEGHFRDALFVRGGSSKALSSSPEKYRMEQILLLQSRSARLRQALADRGLLEDYSNLDAPTTPQPVDWDCAIATPENPKSCLYSFDAEPYTKVVAPIDTNQWITLGALNRLRRTDPSKVEPMWHNKYAIFNSWFRAGKSPYSMYAHLPWQGYMLSVLLDGPLVLNVALLAVLAFVFAVTRPVWESILTIMLTSQFLWMRWPNWGRFVHAALPFKLLLGQMAWKGFSKVFYKIQGLVREYLIQVESRIWEEAIPLTVGEGSVNDNVGIQVDGLEDEMILDASDDAVEESDW